MKTINIPAFSMAMMFVAVVGCTAFTDFDESWIEEYDENTLYNLGVTLADPINVYLLGNGNELSCCKF